MGRDRLIALAGLAFAAALFWFVVFVLLVPRNGWPAGRVEDMNSMRNILGSLAYVRKEFPFAADGRLAAYAAFGPKGIEEGLAYFRSAQSGRGPTLEEVRAHDYRNFPWVRYRRVEGTELVPGKGKVPLLWDPQPDDDGGRVVGFSDTSVRYVEEYEVDELLERHGQR